MINILTVFCHIFFIYLIVVLCIAKASESQRSSDIIGILVNIYGSKELFVNEYRSLLADRILTTFSYNTEREIRYLELLKLRFGESQLHLCEVMLKDIADSKRLNTHLNSGEFKSYEQGVSIWANGIFLLTLCYSFF